MKQTTRMMMLAASMAALAAVTACSGEDPFDEYFGNYENTAQGSGMSAGTTSATTGELASFGVARVTKA